MLYNIFSGANHTACGLRGPMVYQKSGSRLLLLVHCRIGVCDVCLMYVSFVRHHHSFKALSVLLFKIVVEVACDALVQVYHVVAHHVVAVAGIDKVVGLGAGVLAGAEE